MGICGSKDTPPKQTGAKKNSDFLKQQNKNKNITFKSETTATITTENNNNIKNTQPKAINDPTIPDLDPNESAIQIRNEINGNYSFDDRNKNSNKEVVSNNSNKKPTTQAKILLLGSGESGKSTILKQIKIIHQTGFSEREKLEYKPFVFQNICESCQCIIKALKQYDLISHIINLTSEDLDFLLNYNGPLDTENNEPLNPKVADLAEKLILDPTVIDLLSNTDYEFYILDSAKYFFENLNRIKNPDYLPNVTDILRTRKQTSGIFDTKFQMEDLDVHLYDVGGQRSERKKWIHCFDNVTAIIFCVALSEYDQTLLESTTKNRLEESLNLFESVVNSMWFRRTTVILCLNKIDIFIEKLPHSALEKYFPDYVGGANVNKAVKYILWRFKQLNRADLNLIPYVTQATDTNNIKLAFAIIRQSILRNNLEDKGIIM